MSKGGKNRFGMTLTIQPSLFCFTMLGLAIAGPFLLLVRLGEGPTSSDLVAAIVLLCGPIVCFRLRRDW